MCSDILRTWHIDPSRLAAYSSGACPKSFDTINKKEKNYMGFDGVTYKVLGSDGKKASVGMAAR